MATMKGGQTIKQKLADFGKKLAGAKAVRIGFLEKATYPDGKPVAMVAAIQEFGAPNAPGGPIPPRPYFRNMIAKHKKEWPKAIANLLEENDYDAKVTLALVGEGVSRQLRQSIIDTMAPPLSPVTLMLRKMFGNHPEQIRLRDVWEARRRVAAGESSDGVSSKPLVWTGHMLNSVGYEVR